MGMADALKKELQAFSEIESTYERIFVLKALKCVEIQHDMDHKRQAGESQALVDRCAHDLEACVEEFMNICGQVPLHFLGKLVKACKNEQDEDMTLDDTATSSP